MSDTLLTDLYQLTMMQGLFLNNMHRQRCVFDRFYRKNPFGGAYTVIAGLEHVITYLKQLRFTEGDIEYLRSTGIFEESFLAYLKDFSFTGDMYAVPEGTIVFPREPLIRIEAARDEAMLIETALSMYMNHETLIATKARRVRSAAGGDLLSEFGLRRAQGKSAAVYGARATIVGGFNSTSNVLAAQKFGIQPSGTMAHSWVMSFDTEEEAFRAYAERYENMLVLLVDTYDTLHQGVPNAIKIFEEVRARRGGTMPAFYGVRLDSGDLAYLSVEARKMLNAAGFTKATIFASNNLDEYLIADLKRQGAEISAWGVGTKLITADGSSALGGVYKLAGQWDAQGAFEPKMKFSDNAEKVTYPGRKKVLRLSYKESGKLIGDWICLEEETIDEQSDFLFYNPLYPWKKKLLPKGSFSVQPLLVPIFKDGKALYESPSLADIKAYGEKQTQVIWPQYFRLVHPPENRVNISPALHALQKQLIEENAQRGI